MSTTIRPELSEKNPYWISRHRYYELKHFCMQYPIWEEAFKSLTGLAQRPVDLNLYFRSNEIGDPTVRCAAAREYYWDRMQLVYNTALDTDELIGNYIFTGVTNGLSYEVIRASNDIPCCKDEYYRLYRKFFWLLDQRRD